MILRESIASVVEIAMQLRNEAEERDPKFASKWFQDYLPAAAIIHQTQALIQYGLPK